MGLYRRFHLIEVEDPPSLFSFMMESTTSKTLLDLDLGLFHPIAPSLSHLPTHIRRTSTYTYLQPPSKLSGSDLYHLASLSDRLFTLESTVQMLVKPKTKKINSKTTVNYTRTAEINTDDGVQKKYQFAAKIKGDDEVDNKKLAGAKGEKSKEIGVKNYEWSSEFKGRGEHAPVHKFSVEVSTGKSKDEKDKHWC